MIGDWEEVSPNRWVLNNATICKRDNNKLMKFVAYLDGIPLWKSNRTIRTFKSFEEAESAIRQESWSALRKGWIK